MSGCRSRRFLSPDKMSRRAKGSPLDWVPVSLKSRSWNWLGRFAPAARSPTWCACYPQESRKKVTTVAGWATSQSSKVKNLRDFAIDFDEQSSVAKYIVKRCGPPSQGWRLFRERQLSILDRRRGPSMNASPPSEGASALPKTRPRP
jgi:hypothetical protein